MDTQPQPGLIFAYGAIPTDRIGQVCNQGQFIYVVPAPDVVLVRFGIDYRVADRPGEGSG